MDKVMVYIEIGKTRSFAGALEWPAGAAADVKSPLPCKACLIMARAMPVLFRLPVRALRPRWDCHADGGGAAARGRRHGFRRA